MKTIRDIQALDGDTLKALRHETHINQQRFATLSGNSRETLINFERRKKKISESAKRRIKEAACLILALSEIMDATSIAKWLEEPNPGLREKSPMQLIKEGRVDIIWGIIESTKQGSFA